MLKKTMLVALVVISLFATSTSSWAGKHHRGGGHGTHQGGGHGGSHRGR